MISRRHLAAAINLAMFSVALAFIVAPPGKREMLNMTGSILSPKDYHTDSQGAKSLRKQLPSGTIRSGIKTCLVMALGDLRALVALKSFFSRVNGNEDTRVPRFLAKGGKMASEVGVFR
jgi:hypothetical protein